MLCRPGIPSELVGWTDFVLQIDRRFFCFDKEFPSAADAEAVVRRFRRPTDFDRTLVDDVFICLGVPLLVFNVPTECCEERIKEFTAELCLVVFAGAVGFQLKFEPLN